MIREINLYNPGLNQEMVVPSLLRSQSEAEGLVLGREAKKVFEIRMLNYEGMVVYDLYQNMVSGYLCCKHLSVFK